MGDPCLFKVEVANPSYPTPSALLSPTDRQEAIGCNEQYHTFPRPLIKVLHSAHNKHNSTAAVGCYGKYSTIKELKATICPDQSIIGL